MKTSATNNLRPGRILETSLYADDLDRAEVFYKSTLGLSLFAKEANRHLFFKCGDQMLLIFNPAKTIRESEAVPHGAHGPGHVAFAVPMSELDKWKSRLKEKGIAVEKDVLWPNGARSLYFRDPAGNCLELASPLLWDMPETDRDTDHPSP
jgi:catechol-2,3-dioxygenase